MAYMVARQSITTASIRAQCTARLTRIMASAAPTEATARIQKRVSRAITSVLVPEPPGSESSVLTPVRLARLAHFRRSPGQ